MYSSKAFAITTRNAIALLFLSQAFQVTSLEQKVKTFIDKDIKLYNFGYYMSDALYFSDETIALQVIDTCEKEAMLLFNTTASPMSAAGLGGIGKIMKVPIIVSSAIKAEEKCKTLWSFLTLERSPFQAKKNNIFENLLRRKGPH